jgi:hypothetical protein
MHCMELGWDGIQWARLYPKDWFLVHDASHFLLLHIALVSSMAMLAHLSSCYHLIYIRSYLACGFSMLCYIALWSVLH